MLSRVANSIYWMARYVERAENLARFIDVTWNVILDQPSQAFQWEPLIRATGDDEKFFDRHPDFEGHQVRHFLTYDRDYNGSIISSLSFARENARTVREAISSEAWEQLNDFYLFMKKAAQAERSPDDCEFYAEVRNHCHLFFGILEATMSRGVGWHFANIGRQLERADKTSRILDVKYFSLRPSSGEIETTEDDLLWSAVLRSVSGFEMYRKKYHSLTMSRVIDFLILDQQFPRAVFACVQQARDSLFELSRRRESLDNEASQVVGALLTRLEQAESKSILDGQLHSFIDALQTDINRLGDAVYRTFIHHEVAPTVASQSQKQVAS